MKVSIIIPAYNEEKRIKRTILEYSSFFQHKRATNGLDYEIIVVLNGCTDNTYDVVKNLDETANNTLIVINIPQAGKGEAIKVGFANALTRLNNNFIGFVDADMATAPQQFFQLLAQMSSADGIIASRYMPGSQVFPRRPSYKRWGSRIIYEPFVWLLFGLSYYDLQCGAKLFKRATLEKIVPELTITQWAFDVELLYLCKKFNFYIKEVPTIWHDQTDSKLTLDGGLKMFSALFNLWRHHRKNKC